MPLDDFQKTILRVLMPLRSPQSVFAGGSVLHRHAFRMSDDQDLFHTAGEDVVAIARRDVAALRAAGLEVADGLSYEGLVEVVVSKADESAKSEGISAGGVTKLQWVESGSWNFFSPVPDPDFGWRLHMADLAVNKVLAAGGRKQVRDLRGPAPDPPSHHAIMGRDLGCTGQGRGLVTDLACGKNCQDEWLSAGRHRRAHRIDD